MREGSSELLAEKDLTHWPDWPAFPVDAAHAAGSELVMLGYMIWPDSITPDSLLGGGSLCRMGGGGRRGSECSSSCETPECGTLKSDRGSAKGRPTGGDPDTLSPGVSCFPR
ncbi:hypothetical protein AB0O32_23820 [Streptomyces rubiginosohelvolus]|uniref:hypothetical protein n=1 Tax=Streptomyces rubiginosohelvolus TaxID=67362 RepID=UPI00341DDA52